MTDNMHKGVYKGIRSSFEISGNFKLTEFEIAGFDCIYSENIKYRLALTCNNESQSYGLTTVLMTPTRSPECYRIF